VENILNDFYQKVTGFRERQKTERILYTEDMEPYLLDILDFIKAHPGRRDDFVSAFKKLLRGEIKSPHEVIEFCMRELQWPEILDEINSLLKIRRDPRSIAVLEELARVYLPEWEDSDMYAYYRDGTVEDS
jgi:hypothetical protein